MTALLLAEHAMATIAAGWLLYVLAGCLVGTFAARHSTV